MNLKPNQTKRPDKRAKKALMKTNNKSYFQQVTTYCLVSKRPSEPNPKENL
jgi:hypothetical protein